MKMSFALTPEIDFQIPQIEEASFALCFRRYAGFFQIAAGS